MCKSGRIKVKGFVLVKGLSVSRHVHPTLAVCNGAVYSPSPAAGMLPAEQVRWMGMQPGLYS